MTFVKKGVVVPLGAMDDFDDSQIYSGTVIKHAGQFFLYYLAYDGSTYRIGLAISKDGITFIKKGVVVPLGTGTDFDENRLFNASVIKHAGQFFLYYSGRHGSNYRIGLAISKDGITFIKKGVVVPLGGASDFDASFSWNPSVIKHAGQFFLYYSGRDGSNYRIGLAISKDGITFIKKGVVVPLGGASDFDASFLYNPSVIKHAGQFFLYYEAYDGSTYRIGLAISKDGITFIKKGVVVPLGTGTDFDVAYVCAPTVIKHAGRFFMYYSGHSGSNYRIGLAISKDGL